MAHAATTAVQVNAGERLVVVAPHPDDETLGAGGLIQRVLSRGGTVLVVLVTAGDGYVEAVVHHTGQLRPRPADYIAYGDQRLQEAHRAVRELGGDAIAFHVLGFPDGGLDPLLRAHWANTHPERSETTRAWQPPYAEIEHLDVRYDGADLRSALARCLRDFRPTLVAFPDPLDRHPDHHATGIFTLMALRDWTAGQRRARPRLLAYLVHWPNWPPGWDSSVSVSDATKASLRLPTSLPARGLTLLSLALCASEVAGKQRALAQYASQQEVMPNLLAAFVRRTEPFTRVPPSAFGHLDEMIRDWPYPSRRRRSAIPESTRGPSSERTSDEPTPMRLRASYD
jgi:LmbE family N-acetylglucosaminyl deacetylase